MVKLTEVQNMFWGVTLDGGKRYTQIVERSFHISMAALEAGTESPNSKEKYVSVMIQHEKAEFVMCTLEYGRLYQQPLDLNFTEGEEVTFFLNGTGIVHLTGYLTEENQYDDEMSYSDMSEEESEEEAPELLDMEDSIDEDTKKSVAQKRKGKDSSLVLKKKAKFSAESDDEDDDDDDEDEDDDFDIDELMQLNSDEDESDEDSEEEESEDEDDDDDDDQEVPYKHQKAKKQDGKAKPTQVQKKSSEEKAEANTTELSAKKKKKNKNKNKHPDQSVKQNTMKSPATNGLDTTVSEETPKKKKKKKKKNKSQDASQTPNSTNQPSTPSPAKDMAMKKVSAGGLIVEELKEGHGPEAKSGKQVHMYYVGTLAKDGKQFDSCKSGKPFKFKLGKGEVIPGWDVGIRGMKVGGKRKLTIPAAMGYGNKRQGPIPPNSSLVFEVELKAVR